MPILKQLRKFFGRMVSSIKGYHNRRREAAAIAKAMKASVPPPRISVEDITWRTMFEGELTSSIID